MKKSVFKAGDRFKVKDQEFEVVTVSVNEEHEFYSYEIKTVKDADWQRQQDEKAVEAARKAAEEQDKADQTRTAEPVEKPAE